MSFAYWDFQCESCGAEFESLERRSENVREKPCECGGVAKRCLSAVRSMTVWGAAERGTSQERPPWALDTRPLADGVSEGEWRKTNRKKAADQRYSQVKQLVS